MTDQPTLTRARLNEIKARTTRGMLPASMSDGTDDLKDVYSTLEQAVALLRCRRIEPNVLGSVSCLARNIALAYRCDTCKFIATFNGEPKGGD